MIAGLTGGIGSGKSTVARLFAMMGAAVFNSDDAAKAAYLVPEVKGRIIELLGKEAYGRNGKIDRTFISQRIFTEPETLLALNAIIHPQVGIIFAEFLRNHAGSVVIKESALLLEAGVTAGLDALIVVTAPLETRITRVMKRDGLTRQQVESKLRSQLSEEEKIKKADHIIVNDEQHLLIPQTEAIFKRLKE